MVRMPPEIFSSKSIKSERYGPPCSMAVRTWEARDWKPPQRGARDPPLRYSFSGTGSATGGGGSRMSMGTRLGPDGNERSSVGSYLTALRPHGNDATAIADRTLQREDPRRIPL